MFSQSIKDALAKATAKALATYGSDGINVVPVSMIKVNDDTVWLFDFFMGKTMKNLTANPSVALTAWTDMKGVQLKCESIYKTNGSDFDAAVAWAHTQNPNRVVKGLIILTPTAVFDISPGGAFTAADLAL